MPDDTEALTPEEQSQIESGRDSAPLPPQTDDGGQAAATEAPQAPAEADETADDKAQQPKMVPHQALHEERRMRQEAEKQREEERKRSQVLEERMNILLRNMQQPQEQQSQQQAQTIPEIDKDPVGHIMATLKSELDRRDQILAPLIQAVSGHNQQSEAAQATAALAMRASAMEREFASQTPDYQQAYEYLIDSRHQELAASGWTDPAEIQAFMANEAKSLAANAIQKGQNPAETVYQLAKIRGYQAKPGNVIEHSQLAPAKPDPAAVEQLQTIERGQQQARGINRVQGQSSAPLNANTIVDMKEEEFSAWAKKATQAELRRILGA